MKIRLLGLMILGAMAPLAAGCGTIYTVRTYGPQRGQTVISTGASLRDVMMVLGGPDILHESGADTICIYESLAFKNILGVYIEENRENFVLTLRNDQMISSEWVPSGHSMSIFGWSGYMLGVSGAN